MDLSIEVYNLTTSFPESEKFGLTSQIRRCAVSVPSNIAEGASRSSNKDFSRFLQISLGSAFELETQLIIASKVLDIDKNILGKLILKIIEIQKMINGFNKSIKSKIK